MRKYFLILAGVLILMVPSVSRAGNWGSLVWGQDSWTRNPNTGNIGEACYDNETCVTGLACVNYLCMDPEAGPGELGGNCLDNGTCLSGELSCINNICQQLAPNTGSAGGPCYPDDTCDEGLACIVDRNLCTACPLDYILQNDRYSLDLLRQFRDRNLKPSPAGQTLVNTYYRLGPILNETIISHPETAVFIRLMVRAIIPAIEIMLNYGYPP